MKRYAIVMKTHYWDDFCDRQFARLKKSAGHADFFVAVDETIKKVGDINHDEIIRINEAELKNLGLTMATTDGSVIWYNIDYPHYVFLNKYGVYDYFVFVEYDVVANVNIDDMIETMQKEDIAYVYMPLRKDNTQWPWHPMHEQFYGTSYPVGLSCFSVFRKDALEYLLARRQEMGKLFAKGEISFWPNNEGFIPAEIERKGFKAATLSEFGDVSKFDWWPPTDEANIGLAGENCFLHPVLPEKKFLNSFIHHQKSIVDLINFRSETWKTLNKYPKRIVLPLFFRKLYARLSSSLIRRLRPEKDGKPWYYGATPAGANEKQTGQAHNA